MIDLFKNVFWYIIRVTCAAVLHVLQYIPRIQEVYDEAMVRNSYMLKYIPDHLKMQEMCDTAARMHSGCEEFRTLCGLLLPMPLILLFIPDTGYVKKQLKKIHGGWKMSLTTWKLKRCATRLCAENHSCWTLFLTVLKVKRCAIRQCTWIHGRWTMFLISLWHNNK